MLRVFCLFLLMLCTACHTANSEISERKLKAAREAKAADDFEERIRAGEIQDVSLFKVLAEYLPESIIWVLETKPEKNKLLEKLGEPVEVHKGIIIYKTEAYRLWLAYDEDILVFAQLDISQDHNLTLVNFIRVVPYKKLQKEEPSSPHDCVLHYEVFDPKSSFWVTFEDNNRHDFNRIYYSRKRLNASKSDD
jgi:hypothetical protein